MSAEEHCVQVWAPQYKKYLDVSERVQSSVTKMIKGGSFLSHKESLRELGLCNLKEKAQGDLISMYLIGEGKKTEPCSSQWCSMRGQEAKAQTEIQEISCEHNGKCLLL